MRIVIFSDIHANLPALERVLESIRDKYGNPDYMLCAGDLVGIGPFPNEVCSVLRKIKNLICVKGDFDQAVIDGNLKGFDPILGDTIRWTREVLTEENMDFLFDLDGYRAIKLGGFNVLLLHGSPEDYLTGKIVKMEPLENLQRYFESTNADIIVCGHGHIPFFKEFNGRYVINPGSVGQPKDNVKKACYVFMDLATREMVFERVDYNI
ncbi:MAG TPA: metallophosphoesterase, partial [Candidatus Aenigmarchaeota archaeon]|nr:metallophosphoesterase [Candidatus Aenigmarchaeota archaeon]